MKSLEVLSIMLLLLLVVALLSTIPGIGLASLGLPDYEMFRHGIEISFGISHAPRQLWNALVAAVTWGMKYKEMTLVACIACLTALYITVVPSMKNR